MHVLAQRDAVGISGDLVAAGASVFSRAPAVPSTPKGASTNRSAKDRTSSSGGPSSGNAAGPPSFRGGGPK